MLRLGISTSTVLLHYFVSRTSKDFPCSDLCVCVSFYVRSSLTSPNECLATLLKTIPIFKPKSRLSIGFRKIVRTKGWVRTSSSVALELYVPMTSRRNQKNQTLDQDVTIEDGGPRSSTTSL